MRLETGDVYYDKMADTPVLPQHDGSKLIKQLLALNIDIGEVVAHVFEISDMEIHLCEFSSR